MRLKARVAIVTGAGSVGPGWSSGRATAVRFCEESAKEFAVATDPQRLRETVACRGYGKRLAWRGY